MFNATTTPAFDDRASLVSSHVLVERMQVDHAITVMADAGAKIPPALRTALDARDAVSAVEADALTFASDMERAAYACTADDVAGMLEDFAQRRVIANSLTDLRNLFTEVMNRRVRHEFMKAAPGLLAAMHGPFRDAAHQFTEAIRAMPARHDPQQLIDAGADAVAAWHRAVELAETLNTYAAARRVVYRQPTRYDLTVACEFAAPDNWAQASRLALALEQTGRLGIWAVIVENGVPIAWHINDEHAALIARLEADKKNWVPSPKGWKLRNT